MFIIIVILCAAVYWYTTRNHGYWRKKQVLYETPIPLFGTDAKAFLSQKCVAQMASEIYWRHPQERFVGVYRGNKPKLVVRDPDLIRDIMVTDFPHFYSRGLVTDEGLVEPLLQNLFFVDGDLWRMLRQRLTPAFTSGKLKAMFPLIVELAEKLQEQLTEASTELRAVDVRDLMARYTTDFISSCGFGIDANSLSDESSAFKRLGTKIYKVTFWRSITIILKSLFPNFFNSLKYLGQELEDDIISLVKMIKTQRNNKPSNRKDFLDMMIELTQKVKISVESIEDKNDNESSDVSEFVIDDNLVAAQCFIFFAAGFETSTTATAFTLHQLAHHPKVQRKVQEEIDKTLQKYDGKLCYESVKEMTYLEWSLMESLRMFPPAGIIRECTRNYTIPNTTVTLDRGVKIIIPTEAIHNDPQYFDNPKEFIPERFSPENVAKRHKYVYLPFGKGPRYCIGARMGVMQSVAGLAAMLARFTVRPAPDCPATLHAHPSSTIVQNINGKVPLIFEQRTEMYRLYSKEK